MAKKEALTVQMIKDAKQQAIKESNIEYKGYLIIVEPSGRTVAAKNGLYCYEIMSADDISDNAEMIKKSVHALKTWIDYKEGGNGRTV